MSPKSPPAVTGDSRIIVRRGPDRGGDRDVAIIFYSHLTLPFAYLADIHYSAKYKDLAGINFPFVNLSENILPDSRFELDPDGPARKWASVYPNEPYQTWEGSILPLMHINIHTEMALKPSFTLPLDCPWCHQQTRLHFDLGSQPGITHVDRCCTDADITGNMRVRAFLNDVNSFLSDQSTHASLHLKCASLDEESGLDQTEFITHALKAIRLNGTTPLFELMLDAADGLTMQDVANVFDSAQRTLGPSTADERVHTTLGYMVTAYNSNALPVLGRNLGLMIPALETWAFSVIQYFPPPGTPTYAPFCSYMEQFIGRYRRLMIMLKNEKMSSNWALPQDVRLVWTTHLLLPGGYHAWCEETCGRRRDGNVVPDREREAEIDGWWEREWVLPIRRELYKETYEKVVREVEEKERREGGARE